MAGVLLGFGRLGCKLEPPVLIQMSGRMVVWYGISSLAFVLAVRGCLLFALVLTGFTALVGILNCYPLI